MQKTYIRVPPRGTTSAPQMAYRALLGSLLAPAYWMLAHRYNTPGLQFRLECARLAMHLAFRRRAPVPYKTLYHLLFWPMDSTRYFEFDFMWRALCDVDVARHLDVSSPRLFPIVLLHSRANLRAELMNPDARDLGATCALVKAAGMIKRCGLTNCAIGDAPYTEEAFDLITSISVVEHIPEDTAAVQRMWAMLRPGGRLLLSVPCAAAASEQYISNYEYGVLSPGSDGFTFWQRFYDDALLQSRILAVLGEPSRSAIYGEKRKGLFRRSADRKLADTRYPYWREPLMMGQEYTYFERLVDLPGEGVIAMEFIKS